MKPERRIASQAQAEAGTENVKTMTPLRAAQAIAALAGGGGAVLQEIITESTTTASTSGVIPFDATIPQIGEGTAFASLDTTITPLDAASKIEVYVLITGSGNGAVAHRNMLALFVDAVGNALSAAEMTAQFGFSLPLMHSEVAASTTARTYRLRFGVDAGTRTMYINTDPGGITFGGRRKAYMIVREIAP